MTPTQKYALGAIGILIAGIVVGLLFRPAQTTPSNNVGGVYNQVQRNFDLDGIHVGPSGANLTQLQVNTCNLTQYTLGSFPASTTAQFFCAVTGVVSGDLVFGSLPVGAGANLAGYSMPGGGFNLVAAYATSTGQIGVTIANNTGAATSSFSQATTSFQYWIARKR